MTDRAIHRAMQCPHPGCDAWAIVTAEDAGTTGSGYLWECEHGHHGPRFVPPES
jgi:hypothetical protein